MAIWIVNPMIFDDSTKRAERKDDIKWVVCDDDHYG